MHFDCKASLLVVVLCVISSTAWSRHSHGGSVLDGLDGLDGLSSRELLDLYKEVEKLEDDQHELRRAVKHKPAAAHTRLASHPTPPITELNGVKLNTSHAKTKGHRRIFAVIKKISRTHKSSARQMKQRRSQLEALLKKVCTRRLTLCRVERFADLPVLDNSLENAGTSFEAMLSKAMGNIETEEHGGRDFPLTRPALRYGIIIRVNDTMDDRLFPQRPIKRRITFLKTIRKLCSDELTRCAIVPESDLPSGLKQPATASGSGTSDLIGLQQPTAASGPDTSDLINSDKSTTSATDNTITSPFRTTKTSVIPAISTTPPTTQPRAPLTTQPRAPATTQPSTPMTTKIHGKNITIQTANNTKHTYLLGVLHQADVSETLTANVMNRRRRALIRRLEKLCGHNLTMCSLRPVKGTQQVVIRDKNKKHVSNLIVLSPDRNLAIIKRIDADRQGTSELRKRRKWVLIKRLKALCTDGLNMCLLSLVKKTQQVIVRNKSIADSNSNSRGIAGAANIAVRKKQQHKANAGRKGSIKGELDLIKALKVIMTGDKTTTRQPEATTRQPKTSTGRSFTVRYEQQRPQAGKVVTPANNPYYADKSVWIGIGVGVGMSLLVLMLLYGCYRGLLHYKSERQEKRQHGGAARRADDAPMHIRMSKMSEKNSNGNHYVVSILNKEEEGWSSEEEVFNVSDSKDYSPKPATSTPVKKSKFS